MKPFIMLHHSLTYDSGTVSWGAIEKYHTETMGWKDIGYHFGVELVGDRYYALLGRPEEQDAAACYQGNMNKLAYHICCVGNYDLEAPPKALLDVLVKRIMMPLMEEHNIPVNNIVGHRDYAPKTCPGKLFNLNELRQLVLAAGLPPHQ